MREEERKVKGRDRERVGRKKGEWEREGKERERETALKKKSP